MQAPVHGCGRTATTRPRRRSTCEQEVWTTSAHIPQASTSCSCASYSMGTTARTHHLPDNPAAHCFSREGAGPYTDITPSATRGRHRDGRLTACLRRQLLDSRGHRGPVHRSVSYEQTSRRIAGSLGVEDTSAVR